MHNSFAAQSVGISTALVHTECDYFQMYELVSNKDMHVCHQAGSPLSPLMAATAGVKISATTATSAAFQETPALHCVQHPLL